MQYLQHIHHTIYLPLRLSVKHNVISWLFWRPVHYNISHGMLVEAIDCFAGVHRNMVTPLGPLSTLCDLSLICWLLYVRIVY